MVLIIMALLYMVMTMTIMVLLIMVSIIMIDALLLVKVLLVTIRMKCQLEKLVGILQYDSMSITQKTLSDYRHGSAYSTLSPSLADPDL